MATFTDKNINLGALKERAYNYRWATLEEGVIPLTAADPDFPVAEEIKKAIHDYSEIGYFSYGPAEGLPEFKHAITRWHLTKKRTPSSPDFILPLNSAAHALYLVSHFLLDPGEEAIIPNPVDFLFRKSIENAGGVAVTAPLQMDSGEFPIEELEALIGPKTKAIFICNPNNPLGKVMTEKDLRAIGKLACKHNLWLVSDEIWSDIVYQDTSFKSIASLDIEFAKRTFIISGLSKNFGLAGLRIGYLISPNKETSEAVFALSKHDSTAYGLSTLSQIAGTAALNDCSYWLDDFLAHLSDMRTLVLKELEACPLFIPPNPNSTYLAFPKINSHQADANILVDVLHKEAKVALIPGAKNFFEHQAEGHIRICYATSQSIVTEAFQRINHFLTTEKGKGVLYELNNNTLNHLSTIPSPNRAIVDHQTPTNKMVNEPLNNEYQENKPQRANVAEPVEENLTNEASNNQHAVESNGFGLKWLWGLMPLLLFGFLALIFFQSRNNNADKNINGLSETNTGIVSSDTNPDNFDNSETVDGSNMDENDASYTDSNTEEALDGNTDDQESMTNSDDNNYEEPVYSGIDDDGESDSNPYEDSEIEPSSNSSTTNSYTDNSTTNTSAGFYAVFNVFSTKNNAMKQKSVLERSGFDVSIMPHGNLYRVTSFLGSNKESAENKLTQIKKLYQKDAWLLEY